MNSFDKMGNSFRKKGS